jgi:hypothetical protein
MNDAYRHDLELAIRLIQKVIFEDEQERSQRRRMIAAIKRKDDTGVWHRLRRPHRKKRDW